METAEKIRHFNQGQLADRWGVSETTLERWRSEEIGPVFLKLKGQVRYRIEDIESFERDCLRRSTSMRVHGGAVA
ncbi:helix-turn-helix domain-containing protein [Ferrovum sp.]|uniref:helix-turn-helix transcriptional regulator n=1 Tax=Ferrovum sp. TaxID=2609467 RepID=UPI00261AA5E2|nr:helix-turn-helix domain-containing protein [Ferrovum sp.]